MLIYGEFKEAVEAMLNEVDMPKVYNIRTDNENMLLFQGCYDSDLVSHLAGKKYEATICSGGFLTVKADNAEFVMAERNHTHELDVDWSLPLARLSDTLVELDVDLDRFYSLSMRASSLNLQGKSSNQLISRMIDLGFEKQDSSSRFLVFSIRLDGFKVTITLT